MTDVGQVADHFSAEVDRLHSLGLWPLNDHEDIVTAVDALIVCFASARPEEQSLLRSRLSSTAKDVLLGCAGKLGSAALRLGSPDLVTKGLTALALVDAGNDCRDSVLALAYLHECATKLKLSPQVFADAARFVKSADQRRRPSKMATLADQPPHDCAGL